MRRHRPGAATDRPETRSRAKKDNMLKFTECVEVMDNVDEDKWRKRSVGAEKIDGGRTTGGVSRAGIGSLTKQNWGGHVTCCNLLGFVT